MMIGLAENLSGEWCSKVVELECWSHLEWRRVVRVKSRTKKGLSEEDVASLTSRVSIQMHSDDLCRIGSVSKWGKNS